MSTITTISASDQITDSRAVINTNFANLNTDKMETSVLDTDTTLAANSDLKVATQKAVKAYVDAGGNSNASTTQKGIVEEATQAEVLAGTQTGGTGARLFVNPGTKFAPTILKASDETVNNSSTLQNDNDFTFSVSANKIYRIKIFMYAQGGSTADIKFQWSLPTSATSVSMATSVSSNSTPFKDFSESTAATIQILASAANTPILIEGILVIGASAGTAVLQWAQNTATAENLIVKANSFMTYELLN